MMDSAPNAGLASSVSARLPDIRSLSTHRQRLVLDAERQLGVLPVNVQIDSPQRIDPTLFEPFRTREKPVLLVAHESGRVTPASVIALAAGTVVVDVPPFAPLPRLRDRMVVAIPISPQRRYVLQTVVTQVAGTRIRLRCQDPRYDPRRLVQLAAPVCMHPVPAPVVDALLRRDVHILREVVRLHPDIPRGRGCLLTDTLHAADPGKPVIALTRASDPQPVSGELLNISLGGVGITLPPDSAPEEMSRRLVRLNLVLRLGVAAGRLQIRLQPLGLVREVRTAGSEGTLHLSFISRLPLEVQSLLGALG
jgi:hypothetical protein